MDTKKIFAFLETVEAGSINKAAEDLGYTQSGLSYSLNTLENEVGIKLLHRSRNGIVLTPAGKALFPYFQTIVQQDLAMQDKVKQLKNRKVDVIRIGAYSSVMISYLPEVMSAYKAKHKDVAFEMHTGITNIPHWLEEGSIDIAICEQPIAEGHEWYPIFEDEMCVAINDSLPLVNQDNITLEMLNAYPVFYPSIYTKNIVTLRLKELGLEFDNITHIFTDDGSVTLSIVNRNPAVSFISRLYAPECPEHVRIKSLTPTLHRTLGVAIGQEHQSVKTITQFVNFIRKYQFRY